MAAATAEDFSSFDPDRRIDLKFSESRFEVLVAGWLGALGQKDPVAQEWQDHKAGRDPGMRDPQAKTPWILG